ncbi:MAG: tetratricopeptide repeat protein [Verrucomicrobia subdivision 3 bacterium]|nr:tetratricopeptide repeat protein [Limisphaerales bacterium]
MLAIQPFSDPAPADTRFIGRGVIASSPFFCQQSAFMARLRLICLLLTLFTLLVYLRVWQHDYVLYDDPDYVTENRTVQAGLSGEGIQWAFTTTDVSNWHPLTWLSHMLDCELFGLNPGPQHLVNVLFHIANAVVLALLMFRLTGVMWAAGFIAAAFALHPTHVESVAWIAERKDVLSTFFGFISMLCYVRWRGANLITEPRLQNATRQTAVADTSNPCRSRSPWFVGFGVWGFCTLAFFALSLMAKPMLVTLPFVFLLLDYWPLKRLTLQPFNPSTLQLRLLEKWPFFVLTVASCVITYQAQVSDAVVDFDQRPLSLRLLNALVAYARYVGKLFWPTDLCVIYPLEHRLPWWPAAIAAAGLAVISWVVWQWRRRKPYLLVGWLWFLGTLVPVIGIVQVGGQSMADRYTYFPFIGLFIAIAFLSRDVAVHLPLRRSASALVVVPVAALLGCAAVTWRQLGYWKDSETLFTRAVAVTRDNHVARVNLGVALEEQRRFDEALIHYREALRIRPSVQVYNNIGNILSANGKNDEALVYYREVLRLMPHAPLANMNVGMLLLEMDQFDPAMQHFLTAARAAPDDPRPHSLMAKACVKRGQKAQGVAHLREALRRSPDDVQILLVLARLLAADQDASVRNGAHAVKLAEAANELTGGNNSLVLDTLAMAYAEVGRFNEAQQTVAKAIALGGEGTEDISILQERLALYRTNKPYRESATNMPTPPKTPGR